MDEHWLSLGSIMMVVIGSGVLFVGGTILFLTFRHWDQQKEKSDSHKLAP